MPATPRSRLRSAALLFVLAAVPCAPAESSAQAPIEGDGAAALGASLRRLGVAKRVLMIAAHPDDENTAVIAELALGHGADVAYLSLTRGEGGQNLIGPELDTGLGLIRSEELLAARRLDGARQFFTRAIDYGFTRSADEAFTHWPRDSVLADAVEVIRRYRPDIVISVFSGTPADGHGQHQVAGIIARDAFNAAADPQRFRGQLERGLMPHAARYLFQSMWRAPADPPLRLTTGDLDPLFGRSRYQIAMQSRSRHRSQDMGQAEPIGPRSAALRVMDGPYPSGATSLFAALDTTPSMRARSLGADAGVIAELESYETEVAAIREGFNPLASRSLATRLVAATARLDRALAATRDTGLRFLLEAERANAALALRQAAGVVLDVAADDALIVPGQRAELTLTLWNGGAAPIDVRALEPSLPAGWRAEPLDPVAIGRLEPNGVLRRRFAVHVPADATPTEPYFLRQPHTGAMYSWPVNGVRTLPFEDAAIAATAAFAIDGVEVRWTREAERVEVDKALGEVRRPVIVVPAVGVSVDPATLAVPLAAAGRPRTVEVTLRGESPEPVEGVVRLRAPQGWRVEPASIPARLDGPGTQRTVRFTVTPPSGLRAGSAAIHAEFTAGGRTYDRGYTLIEYPHTRTRTLYRDATVRVSSFDVAIAPGLRIGYIEGAGDDGALALRQLGATVEPLDAAALANGDLSRFDAIVAGIRAYEVRPDIIAYNARLLEYARNGGTFIVQYNKYELVEGPFMPYPATMARPHGRITDERSPVRILDAQHPLMRSPNAIGAPDFEGWVQERGLYFLDTFDERYTPLLGMQDPDQPPQQGALVAARVGSGWYVYTGLALFRQLPEGVPGAYRLLANLVSLGEPSVTR